MKARTALGGCPGLARPPGAKLESVEDHWSASNCVASPSTKGIGSGNHMWPGVHLIAEAKGTVVYDISQAAFHR
jgi:hypothetical protein